MKSKFSKVWKTLNYSKRKEKSFKKIFLFLKRKKGKNKFNFLIYLKYVSINPVNARYAKSKY